MSMDHLLRELAPISSTAWDAIEDECKSRLTTYLAARKLVDFVGPHAWAHSSTSLGRSVTVDGPDGGVEARQRQVLPLLELRVPFDISRQQLDDIDRGAVDVDFGSLDDAVRRLGVAENAVVFKGHPSAGITGITATSSHAPIALGDDFDQYRRL